ncbi:LysM domain-containing protein [Podospora didyma]|uniref:LysM domain-containing protein n=1 Tax=Podospora didyma TaxID=330526 RepID=A0AAE0K017_9PEZI|nr:LysM domain-containing protein [Podospora didyma]
MKSTLLFALLLLAKLAAVQAYTVPPPTTAPRDTIMDCTNWHIGAAGDTCPNLASTYFIQVAQLYRYNPSLASGCKIVIGTSYCVEENWGIPPPPPTSSVKSTSTKPTSTGLVTPTPTQAGMVAGCKKFYFVKKTDTCSSVLTTNGISLSQLFAWNTGVKADCSGLWLEVYVCVSGPGSFSSSTAKATTTAIKTSTGTNGIATPTPTQPPSIVPNCSKFYFVQPGTTCATVLSTNGITLQQLFAWNKGVNADCSGMWSSVYLCVGVTGGTPTSSTKKVTTTTTTPTKPATGTNGIATPTPTQPPSIVPNCNKFYFVKPGTSCSAVLTANGITLPQLFAWNSGVLADCSGMWASVYLCVGVIGGTTTSTKSSSKVPTSTTSPGNGVATPAPIQPGMVTNCKSFYKVVDGDTCEVISTKTKVTVKNLQAWNTLIGSACNVWLGYWLCTAVL